MAETEIRGGVGLVDLELEEANAVVELGCYIKGLVGGDVAVDAEGGVVRADHGYVAVFAGAVVRVAIAGLGVCRSCGGGGCGA